MITISENAKCYNQKCKQKPVKTLSYDYKTKTVVFGPLMNIINSKTLFSCQKHYDNFKIPVGWRSIKLG